MASQEHNKAPSPEETTSPRSTIRLFAVVVVYKMLPSDSSSLRTLLAAAATVPPGELDLRILVWDNTPGGHNPNELPDEVLYLSAPNNPGLAVAYNHALKLAETAGYEWLLTLDQDSILPGNFLARIADLARELSPVSTIGAIVPQIVADGHNVSPFQFVLGGVPRWLEYGFVGTSQRATYPANSGATLRIAALRQIGGYDPLFPLDLSDIDLFHRLHHSGRRVYVAGDLLMQHNFALLRKQERMSLERYRVQLLDECAVWDMNFGSIARLERMIRLAGRACKDFAYSRNSNFWKLTLSEFKRRLFTSRRRRVAEWRRWATLRYSNSVEAPASRLKAGVTEI